MSTLCNKAELVFKQWIDSSITLHPPQGSKLKPTSKSQDWISTIGPWEYGYFVEQFPDFEKAELTYDDAVDYLSYNKFF